VIIVDERVKLRTAPELFGSTGGHRTLRGNSATVNGGISRAKNTCLRLLTERARELVSWQRRHPLHEGWQEAYVTAMRLSGIQHFSWYVHHQPIALWLATVVWSQHQRLLGLW